MLGFMFVEIDPPNMQMNISKRGQHFDSWLSITVEKDLLGSRSQSREYKSINTSF